MAMMFHMSRCFMSLALLIVVANGSDIPIEDSSARNDSASPTVSECEARTINYITHTLPQLCPTSTWKGNPDINATESTTAAPNVDGVGNDSHPTTTTESRMAPPNDSGSESTISSTIEGAASPFMSFEDWKDMMLRKTGQDPQDLYSRKASGQDTARDPPDMGHYGLGEEDEISLDFESYLEKANSDASSPTMPPEHSTSGDQADDATYGQEKPFLHRSKDAGKTCKERFSYSSFDAGATILKTGRNTKNAKAILVENKDSYMLLECSVDSKYVIVELSDDILIDTVVLANFEFFSSMIRHFRISVSDRYPVKMERWRDIGLFEARNSRDIQAFLVENPQIWAKYVRIEFLTHYGNEFYCPVSLLRIHGSRMLDSWKDTETSRDEELQIDAEDGTSQTTTDNTAPPSKGPAVAGYQQGLADFQSNFTLWESSPIVLFHQFCLSDQVGWFENNEMPNAKSNDTANESPDRESVHDVGYGKNQASSSHSKHGSPAQTKNHRSRPTTVTSTPLHNTSTSISEPTMESNSTYGNSPSAAESTDDPPSSTTKAPPTASQSAKQRNAGTSNTSPGSPPVQEGFFNAITKRLQHVEANLTLSLQYLDGHSKYMQETLQKVEQKQLSKVSTFLENLNQTVMSEMREMRDQYDQIWQSTVFALESQKKQADHDIVALSSRLNLLADEVVFQKRMAIVQAVLLLCCLFLVIFSRGVPIPYLAPLMDQGSAPNYSHSRQSHSSREAFNSGRNHRTLQSDNTIPSISMEDYTLAQTSSIPSTINYEDMDQSHLGDLDKFGNIERVDEITNNVQLSPPHTPNLQADSSLSDVSTGFELQPSASRRLQSYQHSQPRKPLPALPEYPSPERPSSPRRLG